MEYTDAPWNRRVARHYAGMVSVAGFACTAAAYPAFPHRARAFIATSLSLVVVAVCVVLYRRYASIRIRTEGPMVIVKNGFAIKRFPTAAVYAGEVQTFRSGGFTYLLLQFEDGAGRTLSVRLLPVRPSSFDNFVQWLRIAESESQR